MSYKVQWDAFKCFSIKHLFIEMFLSSSCEALKNVKAARAIATAEEIQVVEQVIKLVDLVARSASRRP